MRDGPSYPTGPGAGDDLSRPRRALEQAQARERELRARLAELVTERRRLWQESERLQGLGEQPGADLRLDEVARRYQAKVDRLGLELETVRSQLRAQAAIVAERKADADGV